MSNEKKNDGGPAYPMVGASDTPKGELYVWSEGMSLRDHFAAKLMPEVYRQYADQANAKNQWDPDWQIHLSVDAYRLADAMLRAREL